MRPSIALAVAALAATALACGAAGALQGGSSAAAACSVAYTHPDHELAAREVRRYLRLSGRCDASELAAPVLVATAQPAGPAEAAWCRSGRVNILVTAQSHDAWDSQLPADDDEAPGGGAAMRAALSPQEHVLKSIRLPPGGDPMTTACVALVGADAQGALFAAYRFAEVALGAWFELGSDVTPDLTVAATASAHAEWVHGLHSMAETAQPTFSTRGLQPFHDFAQGPDWWDVNMYKSVLESIAKLRMNFIGLHTYPYAATQDTGKDEPTVWVGLTEDVNPDGTVKNSYPTSYSNTMRGQWGNTPLPTSNFTHGSDQLFETDCWGSPVQAQAACPFPTTTAANNAVMDATAAMLSDAFTFGHGIGVKTCVGTETPLSKPPPSGRPTAPLNVYYSASRNDTFVTTTQCDECEGLYTFTGITGWVLATPGAGAVPLSTWYSGTNTDNVLLVGNATHQPTPPPAGYSFVRVEGYAPPSAEAAAEALRGHVDPTRGRPYASNLTSLALTFNAAKDDHWAVASAANKSTAAASGYTTVVPSLASVLLYGPPAPSTQDYYEGIFTRIMRAYKTPIDTYWVWTPEAWEWGQMNASNPVFTDAVADLNAAMAAHDAVGAPWEMATCGWVVGPLPDRAVLDKVLPKSYAAISSIDMAVGDKPVDPAYKAIVNHAKWVIPWMEDDPGLTAPQLWVNRTLQHMEDAHAYGCSGLLGIHWRTRQVSPQVTAMAQKSWDATLTSDTFWPSWASAQFGNGTASANAAAIFAAKESFNLPRPVSWGAGPGALNPGQCPVDKNEYAFVDQLASLRAGVTGVANLARFDYWLNSMQYMRAIQAFECAWTEYNGAIEQVKDAPDPATKKQLAETVALPARIALVGNGTAMMTLFLNTVTTPGGLGTILNLLSHSLYKVHDAPVLKAALGTSSLPPDATVPMTFAGASRLVVPVVRGQIAHGETLSLRALVLAADGETPVSAAVNVRPMGSAAPFKAVPMTRLAADRNVWSAPLPASDTAADFEYYVSASLTTKDASQPRDGDGGRDAGGMTLVWPAGAPANVQTVVVASSRPVA